MKNVARRLASRIYWTARKTVNTIRYLCTDKNNRIVVNAWMNLYGAEPTHRNLGDELNFYLVRELTGKYVFNYANLLPLGVVNYSCIGSILEWLHNPKKVVWGTGAMYGNQKLRCKPLKVYAVRGPLTRQYLLGQGVECPEVYGDPALLLPQFYKPSKSKKYRIGIIPHISDYDDPLVHDLTRQMNSTDITVIRMGGYADWHDVIDEINECEFIVSSSLHGLILSDAYGVPNVWVEFSDKVAGQGFKFRDYFGAVGKDSEAVPIRITTQTKLTDLLFHKDSWRPIEIDLGKLLDACPFEVQPQYRNIR